MPTPPLRALIVDDEPLAIERMQTLCADLPDVELIGTASDGTAALYMVDRLSPDLILLDISMPDVDGMAVARDIARTWARENGLPPAIIFVTAFDGFAVEAFDLSAVDYLLKPVAAERLARAIDRVRERRAAYAAPDTGPSPYVSEFWVPNRNEMVRVAVGDIDRIDAERDYVRLHCAGRSFLLHHTMAGLEARLDPDLFIRLHRSVIVRRRMIRSLGHDRAGAWHAELADGSVVRIGRTFLSAAKDILRR
ncbi:MAG: DNA-binding response regulator [Sphingomonadaceae bacterium]|jgi:two-component system, LytTR family, response regulator AlgR|nr:DNA-binding response regulator [Sphingomonadaceae bacterium]NCA00952.1 DNA-binding response regulator [Sphingomonadaceae bacterium]